MIVPAWVFDDREWSAALYLVMSPLLSGKGVVSRIDWERRTIHWPSGEGWSHGELLHLELARHLFSGDGRVSVVDMVDTLSEHFWEQCLVAIQIRRGKYSTELLRDLLVGGEW
jgi:hypothetical protein